MYMHAGMPRQYVAHSTRFTSTPSASSMCVCVCVCARTCMHARKGGCLCACTQVCLGNTLHILISHQHHHQRCKTSQHQCASQFPCYHCISIVLTYDLRKAKLKVRDGGQGGGGEGGGRGYDDGCYYCCRPCNYSSPTPPSHKAKPNASVVSIRALAQPSAINRLAWG